MFKATVFKNTLSENLLFMTVAMYTEINAEIKEP
jgi:hypothetical protein